MEFAVENVEGVVVITPPEVPMHEFFPEERYAEELSKVVDAHLRNEIVADLGRIKFARTPLLAALVRAHLAASRRHRKFALCSPTEFVSDVLRKARLDRLLRIFPSRKEALAAIKAGGDFYAESGS